jgi:hypothetical protein
MQLPIADTWSHWPTAMNKWGCCCFRSGHNKQKFGVQEGISYCVPDHPGIALILKPHQVVQAYVHFVQSWWAHQLWNQTSLQWSWQSLEVLIAEGAHTMLHHKGDISNFLHWQHGEGGPLTTCRQVWNKNKCTLKPSNLSTGHGSKILVAKEGLGTNLACNQVKKMHW